MRIENFIIGPQMVGAIFMLAGAIQTKWPPKKINGLYGYRTPLSMKNQQNWDEGNRYSSRLLIRIGFILVLVGLCVSLLISLVPNKELQVAVNVPILILGSMLSAVLLLTKTERHLEKFEKENL